MVRLQVGAHELLFQGGMKDWKFGARILPVGLSASAGEKVEELEKEIDNPYYTRIKNGHVKFSYDAAPGVQGTVEVFAAKTSKLFVFAIFFAIFRIIHDSLHLTLYLHELPKRYKYLVPIYHIFILPIFYDI